MAEVMSRDGVPQGVPCFVDTTQGDVGAAIEFYSGLFGWHCEDVSDPGSPGSYFMARLDGLDVAGIGGFAEGQQGDTEWSTYIWVDDADAMSARITEAGGTVIVPPTAIGDSGRFVIFADPFGAVLRLWEAETFRGSQLVNAPGSWVFSDLNTTDLDGSKSFFAKVFGWEADKVDFGAGTNNAMVRQPGYGDFLAQRDPEIKRRQEEAGAPTGFSDAVCWMAELGEEQISSGAGSHWGITFSVDDCDEAVKRAEELGAKLLMPPMDMPPVRIATLADPQGAVFTVSKYTP